MIEVSSSPHYFNKNVHTRQMMTDVLISLVPVVLMSLTIFRFFALKQILICSLSCIIFEFIFNKMRNKTCTLFDCSALVTGVILALSLPWSAPWYVGFIASLMAIGLGKVIFGGLGQNIFNPAMVGRAFVMICFPAILGASSYVASHLNIDILTQATPLTTAKQLSQSPLLFPMFLGTVNGSLGETSALACLLGGIYLCIKRVASYEIPLSIIITVTVLSLLSQLTITPHVTLLHHLFGGSLMFGAFFIATDPVTSPLTQKGKIIFGTGCGFFIMLIRIFSGYPEGVMFAVLLMNALSPLINQISIPRPVGGGSK